MHQKMAVLNKELQKEIDDLVDQAYEEFEHGDQNKSFELLIKAWDLFPNPKEQWNESFNVSKYLIDDYLRINDFENANKWLDQLRIINDRHKIWHGVLEFYQGMYYFKLKDFKHAKEAFDLAFKRSEGRQFEDEDPKYLDFLQNPEKYMTK